MMSGMRKPSPISISSPRETMASPPAASSLRARKTAAALLLTAMPGAPDEPFEQRLRCARRVCRGVRRRGRIRGWSSRRQGRERAERGAAQIGVQNDAGGVDDAAQRRALEARRAHARRALRGRARRDRPPGSPRAPHRWRAGLRRRRARAESGRGSAQARSSTSCTAGSSRSFAGGSRIRWYVLVCQGCNRLD